MRWMQAFIKKVACLMEDFSKRSFVVIVSSMSVVAVVSMLISGIFVQSKNKVYEVQASDLCERQEEETGTEELQAGLMGIVNSINSMEEYCVAASSVDITTTNEKVMVGTSRVRRKVLNKLSIGKCTKQISGIGYYAQQMVRDNHMASEDYYALLQIVEAEMTGGDIKSKILIADVVLNRVQDSDFPDSIYEVVWDREGGITQFSPTEDGRIYTVEITEDTYEAVDRALAGEDYSQGALFFMARSGAEEHNRKWFDKTLQRLFEYGGHEYYTFADR